jgi:hypothetical protein
VRDLEILADPAETVAARAISTRPTFPYSSANTRLNPGARCESLLSRLIAAIRATTIERQGSTREPTFMTVLLGVPLRRKDDQIATIGSHDVRLKSRTAVAHLAILE